jgi:hypothetical protein
MSEWGVVFGGLGTGLLLFCSTNRLARQEFPAPAQPLSKKNLGWMNFFPFFVEPIASPSVWLFG